MLEVIEAGLLTTIQDLGRPDAAALGVPRGGACDPWSLKVANALLDNSPGAPAVEITLAGPALRARADCRLALAGAELDARIAERGEVGEHVDPGEHVEPGTAFELAEGQTLSFGSATERTGIRAYLALEGGVSAPAVLGSASTCLVGGFGGIGGRRLEAGDLLPPAEQRARVAPRPRWRGGPRPSIEASIRPLRVLAGPHVGRLGRRALERLVTSEYRVSPRGDRQAIVLDGPGLMTGKRQARMLSQPVVWGAIQLPPDGRPICLLADHQTVGGYPVVAVVISADLPCLGQLGPGDALRFSLVSQAEAQRALEEQEDAWQAGLAKLAHIA